MMTIQQFDSFNIMTESLAKSVVDINPTTFVAAIFLAVNDVAGEKSIGAGFIHVDKQYSIQFIDNIIKALTTTKNKILN